MPTRLPALQAALQAIQAEGVDEIYHTGDAVNGPFPAETLDSLLNTPGMCQMGDYDAISWTACRRRARST